MDAALGPLSSIRSSQNKLYSIHLIRLPMKVSKVTLCSVAITPCVVLPFVPFVSYEVLEVPESSTIPPATWPPAGIFFHSVAAAH